MEPRDCDDISQTLAGDREAFGALVTRYHGQIFSYVVARTGDSSIAEDIVQKSFVDTYNRLSSFDIEQSFQAWVQGIAFNHCRNHWRQSRREAQLKCRLLELRRSEQQLGMIESSSSADPKQLGALRECLGTLSEYEQNLVSMRFSQNLSLKSIALQLGRNSEALRQLLFRMRVRLGICIRKRLALQRTHQ